MRDGKLRNDPAAIAFQERVKGGQETLFVKNLENVQGDERDVIFISITYGPDTRGNHFQRFGPINGPSGHRRLNVLFTRAKKRAVVFSSLDPERMQTTANSPWGVRALNGGSPWAYNIMAYGPKTRLLPCGTRFPGLTVGGGTRQSVAGRPCLASEYDVSDRPRASGGDPTMCVPFTSRHGLANLCYSQSAGMSKNIMPQAAAR
jgi:hypothetical protein